VNLDGEAQQVVCITVLGANTTIQGRILSASGRKMMLACEDDIPVDSTVRISWANYLVMGEVWSAQESGKGLLVHIRHALRTADIDQIRSRWV
jgi:hypothetical protein